MKQLRLWIFSFGFFLFSISAMAQNVNDVIRLVEPGTGSSVRALGMGNAFTGLADDGTAVLFNPAGLALVKRMEFTGALEYQNFSNTATFFGNSDDYSNSSTALNNIGFVFPLPTVRGSMSFGFTYNTTKNFNSAVQFDGFNSGNTSMIQSLLGTGVPYNLFLTDDDGNTIINGNLNQSGTILESGSLNNWGISAALEVHKNLFVGGTLNIHAGSWEYNREYYEDDTRSVYSGQELAPGNQFSSQFRTFFYNSLLDWDISGWDFNLGFLYQVHRFARIGASIQFPRTYYINEQFRVDGRSEWGDGTIKYLNPDDYTDNVEYSISSPFTFRGGFSVNFMGLILAGSVKMTDYSQSEMDSDEGLSETYVAGVNKDIKDLLRNVVDYNFGIEYTVPELFIRVRAGFFTQGSPYRNDPAEFDKKYFTGGLGFLVDQTVSVDFAYAHGQWETYGDNYGSGVSRINQEVTVDKFIIGFGYRF